MLLPAALRFQTEVATAITAAQTAIGAKSAVDAEQTSLLKELRDAISALRAATRTLDSAVARQPADKSEHGKASENGRVDHGPAIEHAHYMRNTILPAMAAVRSAADKLETLLDDGHWPLPTYREMWFMR